MTKNTLIHPVITHHGRRIILRWDFDDGSPRRKYWVVECEVDYKDEGISGIATVEIHRWWA